MTIIDWLIILVFLVVLVAIGCFFSRKNRNVEDYFVAGRSMPGWIVAIAATGTAISAGTFVGSPELGFNTNLTYVMNLVGAIIGGTLVALLILPRLYAAKTITIYGFIGGRFGESSRKANSLMFLIGQLFNSGSRLFIAAIAISVIVFGGIQPQFLIYSIIILGIISTIYTMLGGIKGLLYIDTFQTLLVVFTGLFALVYVACDLGGVSLSQAWHTLTDGGTVKSAGNWVPGSKLQIFDFSLRFDTPYTVWAGIIGVAFFRVAQFTTDQEFVQRQLTCKSAREAGRSLIVSQFICLPMVLVFMLIGSLLYVKYTHDPLTDGQLSAGFFNDARDIFPQYIKNHIPVGLRGLMITGLLAAALSSFNSAINSMASSFVSDIYLPLRQKRKGDAPDDASGLKASKMMVLLMGLLLTGFAILTCLMQQNSGLNLVDFATGIMCFAYSGMVGVFLTAIFTKRGNNKSVVVALIAGALITVPLMFQSQLFGHVYIAWTWWCPIGGSVAALICMTGKNNKQ